MAEPTEDPVPFEIIDEREEGRRVSGGGYTTEHPDDEEVIRDHGVPLC